MKRAKSWILSLLFLQALCAQGQETTGNEEVAKLFRDADEIRVVSVDYSRQDGYLTGYQCVLPDANRAVAQAFADATITVFRDEASADGFDGPASSLYMVVNLRKKGEVIAEFAVVAYYIYFLRPRKTWYRATYKDAPWTDNSIPSDKSFIERRIFGLIQDSITKGNGWKQVDGSLKGFLKTDVP